MFRIFSIALAFFGISASPTNDTLALPIGFSLPQEPRQYHEITSPHFHLYHDAATSHEARYWADTLEQARPVLQSWLGDHEPWNHRTPVVTTWIGTNASFANFLTDAIEIQGMGEASAGLARHELTHHIMYRHLDNIFGPAGSIIYLPFIPSWFIEGLAEATSSSLGSALATAIVDDFAINGGWPSYARLHSLYGNRGFGYVGYAVAGDFVAYIIRRHGSAGISEYLKQVKQLAQPWRWPWLALPLLGDLPSDEALAHWTGRSGPQLYAAYKKWREASARRRLPKESAQLIRQLNPMLNNPRLLQQARRRWQQTYYHQPSPPLLLAETVVHEDPFTPHFQTSTKSPTPQQGRVTRILKHSSGAIWQQAYGDSRSICWQSRGASTQCLKPVSAPLRQALLGTLANTVLIAESPNHLAGYKIYRLDLKDGGLQALTARIAPGDPIAATSLDDGMVLASKVHGSYLLRFTDSVGNCRYQQLIPVRIVGLDSTGVLIRNHTGWGHVTYSKLSQIPPQACSNLNREFSAVDIALMPTQGQKTPPQLDQVLSFLAQPGARQERTISHPQPSTKLQASQPAQYRGRSVFFFPWIASDGEGLNYGVRSIPWMDHLQNHTVYADALYGINSRFPSMLLRFENTKFQVSYSVSAYNQQTFNGVFDDQVLYYRETGIRTTARSYYSPLKLNYNVGIQAAQFKPVIGPLHIFTLTDEEYRLLGGLRRSFKLGDLSLGLNLSGFWVPEDINDTWSYNDLRSSLTSRLPIGSSGAFVELGFSGSRTRGERRKFLQQVYRPLKTFVPGSGGGYNGTNYTLAGPGNLTGAQYGDTLGRARFAASLPLIDPVDRLWGIFYLDRLDLTYFFNHGGAWNGATPPSNRLTEAHGLNLDLTTDIKGVTINGGIGVGAVIGEPAEVYFSFAFDSLVDIE